MLIEKFQNFVAGNHLFTRADDLLLAVSGGVDSVVLCDLCSSAGYRFAIAHCNFQLRGDESNEDERFVRKLAEKYGAEVFVKRFGTENYASANRVSIQVAARELRYQWFEELRQQGSHQLKAEPFTFVVTAHHADDNIETMLMNFFKGTGIKGLQAILPKKGKIVRPLLFAYKEELEAYALEKGLTIREDLSNFSNKYTRNYFRNVLIPGVEEVFPKVKKNLTDNIDRFREIGWLYEEAVDRYKSKLVERAGGEVKIPIAKLRKIKPLKTVLYEIVKDYGFTTGQVQDIMRLMNSESGHFVASKSHRVVHNRGWLVITPVVTEQSHLILISEEEKKIVYPGGILRLEKTGMPVDFAKGTAAMAFLDAGRIMFPLILRPWRQGDYFYPLGLQKKSGKPGKKKLSRLFVNFKLSVPEKEKVWVLESAGRVVWVIGYRADERFKIVESTREVLIVTNRETVK